MNVTNNIKNLFVLVDENVIRDYLNRESPIYGSAVYSSIARGSTSHGASAFACGSTAYGASAFACGSTSHGTSAYRTSDPVYGSTAYNVFYGGCPYGRSSI